MSTCQVAVKGTSSELIASEGLFVGGNGSLSITDGGVVNSGYGCITGLSNSSVGDVIVEGTGSKWANSTTVHLGGCFGDRVGLLTIKNGGLVSVGDSLTIDANLDGDGFVNMATEGCSPCTVKRPARSPNSWM